MQKNVRYQLAEQDELAKLRTEQQQLTKQRSALKEERSAWLNSAEVQRIEAKKKALGVFSAEGKAYRDSAEYQDYLAKRKEYNSRLAALEERDSALTEQMKAANERLQQRKDAQAKDAQRAYDAKAKEYGGNAEYRRVLAKEQFGVTEEFRRAGYILPDGQMLDFAQNDRSRDTDHREILEVFGPAEVKNGTEALNEFLLDGNVRVMAEAPGVDISADTAPTAQQLEQIRKMAEQLGGERRQFTLDISTADGRVAASKEYSGRVDADKVVREIREYYKTGELAQESSLAKFRFQLAEQASREAEDARAGWLAFCQQEPLLQTEVEKKYQDAARSRPPDKIVQYQTNYQNQVDKALDEWLRDQLIPRQREYNTIYTCDYPLGLDGIETFREQQERLVYVDLERYSTSLHQAQERCRQRFREDILYRMKDDIYNAKRQFRELNHTMENLQYGEEVYQFVVQASADPERRAFYDVIMQDSNRRIQGDGSIEDFLARNDPAYETQVDELMERILAELKANAQRRQEGKHLATELSRYVDYRYYLEYDIECRNQITGGVTRLSAVSQDSSGGENQAPFYIAICASLLQIYDKCENSIRLALLDEAFSRMTSDRIRPMMQMLRKMQLQTVLITTVEKASAIQPYCDTTCSIIKSGTRNAVRPFYQDVRE